MKKIFSLCSVLCLIMWFTACSKSGGSSGTITSHVIKGQAAIGAFLDIGAQVEIRPIPVSGAPCDIITTAVVDDIGTYTADVSKVTQAGTEILSEQSNVSGYIIRAMAVSGWIYSFADNTDGSTISNINPYTNLLVQKFYQGAYEDISVDFPTGYKTDGITPISSPNVGTVEQVISTMSNMLSRVYGMPSIEDFMTAKWEEGVGLDGILNNATTGPYLNWFLNDEFSNLLTHPDVLLDGSAIQDELGNPIIVDIWTPFGNTGTVTLGAITDMQGHVSGSVVMTKEADSVVGNNHFHAQTSGVFTVSEQNIEIYMDDYNSGGGFQMVIQTP